MHSIRNLSDRLVEKTRGAINPLLIRATRRSEYEIAETLVIAGFPRSGTTWLAELIASIPGHAELFEPLDHRLIPAAKKAGLCTDNLHAPDDTWPEGKDYLEKVLSGKVLNSHTTSHIPCNRALNVSRWVVKFVRANQMLGWLIENFPFPPPVLLIRHPCAVFSSWVMRGWPLMDWPLPADLRFFSYYPEYKDFVRSLNTPEEIFASQWAIQYRVAFDHLRERDFYLCSYEKLVSNGTREIESVFSHWSLPVPKEIDTFLRVPSAKASSSLKSNTGPQLDSWQRRLDQRTIDRITDVIARLGLHFYTKGPEADYQMLYEFAGRHDNVV